MFAYNLPPIIGLGTGSGFEYQLQSLSGATPAEIAAVARGLVFAANQNPALSRVFTTYSASTPQLYLDIDRDKVQTLGIDLSEVFNALQSVLGSFYVNDFNLFGRTWQVNIQGEAVDRTRDRRHLPHQRAQQERRHGAGPRLRRGAAGARAAVDRALQQLPQRRRCSAVRRPAFRRAMRSRRWKRFRRPRCRAATASNGPARRCRRRRRPARPRRSSRWPWCSPTCSWSASMRARRFRFRCCCRSRSASPVRWWRCCCSACRTTSTRRSVWSC